jgi:hypothetical protein
VLVLVQIASSSTSNLSMYFQQLDVVGGVAPHTSSQSSRLLLQQQHQRSHDGAQELNPSTSSISSDRGVGVGNVLGVSGNRSLAQLQQQLQMLDQLQSSRTPARNSLKYRHSQQQLDGGEEEIGSALAKASASASAPLPAPAAAAATEVGPFAVQVDAVAVPAAAKAQRASLNLQAELQRLNAGNAAPGVQIPQQNKQLQQQVEGPIPLEQWQQEQEQQYKLLQGREQLAMQQLQEQQQLRSRSALVAKLDTLNASRTAGSSSVGSSHGSSSSFSESVTAALPTANTITSSSSSTGVAAESNTVTSAAAAAVWVVPKQQVQVVGLSLGSSSQLKVRDKGANPEQKEAFARSIAQAQAAAAQLQQDDGLQQQQQPGLGRRPLDGIGTIELPQLKKQGRVVLQYQQQVEQQKQQTQGVSTREQRQEQEQHLPQGQTGHVLRQGKMGPEEILLEELKQMGFQQQQQQQQDPAHIPAAGGFSPTLMDTISSCGGKQLGFRMHDRTWVTYCFPYL